jgi:hypothetical protein
MMFINESPFGFLIIALSVLIEQRLFINYGVGFRTGCIGCSFNRTILLINFRILIIPPFLTFVLIKQDCL